MADGMVMAKDELWDSAFELFRPTRTDCYQTSNEILPLPQFLVKFSTDACSSSYSMSARLRRW